MRAVALGLFAAAALAVAAAAPGASAAEAPTTTTRSPGVRTIATSPPVTRSLPGSQVLGVTVEKRDAASGAPLAGTGATGAQGLALAGSGLVLGGLNLGLLLEISRQRRRTTT
ncbi:MAG TPA: hypothetical protein VI854_06685 [Acidimicrobiia bacterium]|nr:hypothetical protein [Acidimicrobiia bacterium]